MKSVKISDAATKVLLAAPSPASQNQQHPPSRWIRRLVSRLIARRYAVVLFALAVSLLSSVLVYDLLRLHVRTNFYALLPDNHPSVRHLLNIIDKTGGFGDFMVVIQSPDVESNRRYARNVHAALTELPWVLFAEFRIDTKFFAENAMLYMDLEDLDEIERRIRDRYEYEVSEAGPMFIDLLDEGPPPIDFSDIEGKYMGDKAPMRPEHSRDDGRTLVVAVYPKGISGAIAESRLYLAQVEEICRNVDSGMYHPDMTVRIGGKFRNKIEEYDSIMNDAKRSFIITIVLIFLLLSLYYRQVACFFLVFVTAGMPLLWTFGLTRLVINELNFITLFLLVILFGLGVDFVIHALTRYQEERSAGESVEQALLTITGTTARASFTSAITTSLAFTVLMTTDFRGFNHFGFIAGSGVMFAFCSSFFVLPALIAIAENHRLLRTVPARFFALPTTTIRRRIAIPVLGLCLFLALAGVGAAPEIEFEYDFANLKTLMSQEYQDVKDTIARVFKGKRDPVIILADTLTETAEIEVVLTRKKQNNPRSRIDSIFSVNDVVPPDQDERIVKVGEIRHLVEKMKSFADPSERDQLDKYEDLLDVRPVSHGDLPPSLSRQFFGLPGTKGNLVFVRHDVPMVDTRLAAELVEEVRAIEIGGQIKHGASEAIVIDDLLGIMKDDSKLAIPLSLLCVVVALFVDFRTPKDTFTTLLPLVVGMCWLMLLLWFFEIKLNLYNMIVLPSIIGIGVDSGIHIYRRFLETPGGSATPAARGAASATSICALTTMIGFGSLVFSVHGGLASLGRLALLGMSCTLIAATLVLPLFLQVLRGDGYIHKRSE